MKVHNSKTERKIELRRAMVARMREPLRVLELYAGPGAMRAACWHDAEEVVGIDADLRSVAEYHGDTCATLRHLDISRFNVFDADAFAAPWEAVWLISRRSAKLPDEIAVFATAGAAIAAMHPTYRAAGWSQQQMDACQVTPDMPLNAHLKLKGASLAARQFFTGFFPDRTLSAFATASGGKFGGTLYAGGVLKRASSGG